MSYRQLDHTADVGLDITAPSLEALFSEAAEGMFSFMVDGPAPRPATTLDIRISGDDREALLVDWLRELLYLWHTRQRRYRKTVAWRASAHTVTAAVMLDRFDPAVHEIIGEIKAVTYHQISVHEDSAGWRARVIFDV